MFPIPAFDNGEYQSIQMSTGAQWLGDEAGWINSWN